MQGRVRELQPEERFWAVISALTKATFFFFFFKVPRQLVVKRSLVKMSFVVLQLCIKKTTMLLAPCLPVGSLSAERIE